MSYSVRSLRRCASRSLPFDSKNLSLSSSSASILPKASSNLSLPMTNCLAGVMTAEGSFLRRLPVNGSISESASTSSPKNSTLMAFVSYAGKTSTFSPRTLKTPGANSWSFREYCASTSRAMKSERESPSPTAALTARSRYSVDSPSPYMHETDATTMTSLRAMSAFVAARR